MNYPVYPEYKESGAQWLGQVPGHWEVKRIKEVSSLVGRIGFRGYSTDDLVDEDEGAVSLSPSNMVDGVLDLSKCTWLSWEKYFESPEIQIQPYDVVMVKTGSTIGKTAYVETVSVQMTINPQLMIFKNVKCFSRYLFYFVSSNVIQDVVPLHNTGSTIPTMTQNGIGKLPFPYPPLPEQIAIAGFLDRKTGRIDTLVAKKRRLVSLLKEQRSALISHAVTRGLPEAAAHEFGLKPHTRFKDSGIEWLGEVPDEWDVLPLRRLIMFVKTGNTPNGAEEHHFEENGFNWFSPSDFSDAVYLGTSNRSLSQDGKSEVRIFPEMTVMLVGIGATIGKVGLAIVESSCNQQINAIIPNGRLESIFATYYLKTMRDFIVKCGKFTTMPIINQDETKNLIVTVPSLSEQTAIATYLDSETSKINQLVEKVEAAIARLQEYRTALITDAVTGKIDVRESVV